MVPTETSRVPTEENLENENGHGKSWNVQNWPEVMEFCYQSWNFTNYAPELCDNLYVFLPPLRN